MSENYSPSGTVSGTALKRPTVGEATGSFGTDQITTVTEIGDRTRYLANDGTIGLEAVAAPTLLNSWVNYDVAGGWEGAGYFKDRAGRVFLQGLIKSGTATAGTTLFTLPSGYRPAKTLYFAVTSNFAGSTTLGSVYIDATGDVKIAAGSNVALSLSGIHFRV
jgi:hypothetical protein